MEIEKFKINDDDEVLILPDGTIIGMSKGIADVIKSMYEGGEIDAS